MSRPLSPEVRELLWGTDDPPGPDHDRCRVCDEPLRYPVHRLTGVCGSGYCEGYEDGLDEAERGAPTHLDSFAGCVGAGSHVGPSRGGWVDAVGFTADDAIRAEVSDG